jgi:hypothetical protein
MLAFCCVAACSLPDSADDGSVVAPVAQRTWQANVPEVDPAFVPDESVQCKNAQAFNANVLPQLRKYCVSCHAGNKLSATLGLDLRPASPTYSGASTEACRYVLSSIDMENKLESGFFTAVDPANKAVHDFKFATAAEYDVYRSAAVAWLGSE